MGYENYTEIHKLKDMLNEAEISFGFYFRATFEGYQILYPDVYDSCSPVCSVIQHKYSYGHEEDLLELSGLLTREEMDNDEDVIGWLTAENVFGRIKEHWDKNKELMKEMEII
jgi:hypothetical protein